MGISQGRSHLSYLTISGVEYTVQYVCAAYNL